jgi:hypothetical protein
MKTATFTAPAGSSYPLTATPSGYLQIWSGEDDSRRPDVFQLEDGRICRIGQPTTASGERDCYPVQILSSTRYFSDNAHRQLTGNAGLAYRHRPSGMWELYPVERNVKRYQRAAERVLISASEKATPRAAALALIVSSDAATGPLYYASTHPGTSHKVGNWRVTALPEKADYFTGWKPGPGERRVQTYGAQFLVTFAPMGRTHPDSRLASAVVSVRAAVAPGGGYCLEAETLQLQIGNGTYGSVDVPASVERFCLSRCRV